jgi:nicotinamide mononucleotide transporter pnuC
MTSFSEFLLFFSPDNVVNGALVLLGTLLGIPYVYLQYKASPKFWVASALNALPFIYVNFVQGNFATAGLFVYYLLVAVQAIFFKHEEVTEEGVFLIYTTPRRKYLPLLLISILLLLLFYGFLSHVQQLLGHSFLGISVAVPQTPLLDAFATALSCTGMWLISRKYMEHWLIWIVVNLGYVGMYVLQLNYFWAGLFFLYLVMSVVGWLEWRKLHQQQQVAA